MIVVRIVSVEAKPAVRASCASARRHTAEIGGPGQLYAVYHDEERALRLLRIVSSLSWGTTAFRRYGSQRRPRKAGLDST